MRSVPHRVVCLLGLDDGVFPRRGPRDGDDLLLEHPHVGERDARSEDRQQLLDALMAAGDTLIVTYTGNDERTNLPQPPAVPVGELLDVVGRTVVTGDAHGVLVRHPLQPFDPRNFVAGELIGGRAWSFDRAGLDGARALEADRIEPGPFLPGPLPPPDARIVELEDLLAFVAHPVRAFLRHRLGVSVRGGEDEVADGLPVELDALERYQVGQRLLEARLEGTGRREAILAEIARGTLPPGGLGRPVVAVLEPVADAIYAQAGAGAGESVDVRVALADGRLLSGTVPGVAGDTLRAVSYARVGPRHRLQAWVRLLALTAAHPERSFDALTVGRVRLGADGEVTVARIPPLDAGEARAELAVLLDLYDRGMREPAPLACTTSAAYAGAGSNAARAAAGAWESAWNFDKEDRDREHLLVLGGERTFVQLCEEGPRPDESGPGWDERDPTRFGRWARRLWDPLLRREELREA